MIAQAIAATRQRPASAPTGCSRRSSCPPATTRPRSTSRRSASSDRWPRDPRYQRHRGHRPRRPPRAPRPLRLRRGGAAALRRRRRTATIVGRAGGVEVRGTGRLEVLPLSTSLRVTPRTLQRRSCGEDVLATDHVRRRGRRDAGRDRLGPAERRRAGRAGRPRERQRAASEVRPGGGHRRPAAGVVGRGAGHGTLRGLPFVGLDHIRVIE